MLPRHKQQTLIHQLKTARRVEFTLMTEHGQEKGHAVVAETLDVGLRVCRDIKTDMRLVNGQTFLGINFVEGHDDMRLDVQSLINLYPFWNVHELLAWLEEDGSVFIRSILSGDIETALSRIDRDTTLDERERWHLKAYFASGGQALWFASIVHSLMNQRLKRLNHTMFGRMRLPVPGGRYYLMPADIGKAAGLSLHVPRGHLQIDPGCATVWVNGEDWTQLEGSEVGIAAILCGADNDDALWLFPFVDEDGHRQVLAWRSPNQVGEYVVLKPTPESADILWKTPDGRVTSWPRKDRRLLPPRIDRLTVDYLGLVDATTAGGLGEGQPYHPAVMPKTIERAVANGPALGMV